MDNIVNLRTIFLVIDIRTCYLCIKVSNNH